MAETSGSVSVRAPAKINLQLAVGPLRPDGFHEIGTVFAALVGSSTQPDPAVTPADLDLLVRFPQGLPDRGQCYLGLLRELGEITGLPVDLIEIDAVRNARLRREFERTQVVLLETA